jgi:hypothetical protein
MLDTPCGTSTQVIDKVEPVQARYSYINRSIKMTVKRRHINGPMAFNACNREYRPKYCYYASLPYYGIAQSSAVASVDHI